MDFGFDDDQELLRTSTRGFLERRNPVAQIRTRLEAPEVFVRDVWREGAELGWTALLVPEEYGGGSVSAQPLIDLVVIAEEFGRALQPGPLVPTNVVADALVRSGSEQQRQEFLPGIADGSIVAAWCGTSDGTADRAAVGVRARSDGSGYICSGTAGYVQDAAVADAMLVAVETDAGLDYLIVAADTPGISVRPLLGLDPTRRFAEVRFDEVAVPASSLVGDAAGAPAVWERNFALATVLQAVQAVGAAEHLFATTVDYLSQRVQFGRTIASFQAIKHRLADLLVCVEAMRAAAHYAALAVADDLDDAREAVATAGAYVTETHAMLCGECVQLTGGIGFTWEHDLHLFLRRARVDEVLLGDPAWHRERLCALVAGADGQWAEG
jgi:alkylation response protein AidB-like acyl-CoA dehydrogenase